MNTTPLFSIIIPNFNGSHFLEECLQSVHSLNYPRDRVECIVVDNGSTDTSSMLLKKKCHQWVRVVQLNSNLGFTGAIMEGVRAAQGDYLVFLNNDMRVAPHWLQAFSDVFSNHQISCAAGMILNWTGDRIDFVEGIMLFCGHGLQHHYGRPIASTSVWPPTPGETFMACGGNMAIRRSLFRKLGGFDDDYFAYIEDVDFAWRLRLAGERVHFVPEALAYHHHAGTSNRLGVYRRSFLYERNAFITLFKNIEDKYFHQMVYLAWLTLIHRTREVISLHAQGSEVLGLVPFFNDRADQLPVESNVPNWRVMFAKLATAVRNEGILSTIGWILVHVGQSLTHRRIYTEYKGSPTVMLDHPWVIAQFQAIWYILANMEKIVEKRKTIQGFRKIGDSEIFSAFPPWVVPTYPGDQSLFSSNAFIESLPMDIPFRFATLKEIQDAA